MARSDQGYTQARVTSRGGGARRGLTRGLTLNTYAAKATKAQLADFYIRTELQGVLDVLGIDPTSDQAMVIREGIAQEVNDQHQTKEDMKDGVRSEWKGKQARLNNEIELRRLSEAEVLIGALESTTRSRERGSLDEGDWLDDAVSLIVSGDNGWGDEVVGSKQYRKHINIAVDNSGSTHMPETGYCANAMSETANNLVEVLYTAAGRWPGVTWDAFSFNRIAEQNTGWRGVQAREEIVRQSLARVVVDDPLQENATQTNLAPLIQMMLTNEEERGLIGSPRLDIILTDGEFESQEDADEAGELQRQRGPGVTTYVLNLCPETPSEVALPHQFRVIPLDCITGESLRKEVDREALRVALMRIVIDEVERDS